MIPVDPVLGPVDWITLECPGGELALSIIELSVIFDKLVAD